MRFVDETVRRTGTDAIEDWIIENDSTNEAAPARRSSAAIMELDEYLIIVDDCVESVAFHAAVLCTITTISAENVTIFCSFFCGTNPLTSSVSDRHRYRFMSPKSSTMRVFSIAFLLSTMDTSSAFAPYSSAAKVVSSSTTTSLQMSSQVKVPITITGDGIDLTPALSDYVNLKVDRTLGKLSAVSGVSHCDVFLTVNKNPKVCVI
jgi:hypothetical protein